MDKIVKMLYWQSIWRAFAWLLIGIVFGLASILLVLASSAIFSQSIPILKLIDANIIVFLSLALMGGVGADFLLSNISNVWRKSFFFIVPILFFGFAAYIFNPNNSSLPSKYALRIIEWAYCLITVVYCMVFKSIIFYQERLTHKMMNFETKN